MWIWLAVLVMHGLAGFWLAQSSWQPTAKSSVEKQQWMQVRILNLPASSATAIESLSTKVPASATSAPSRLPSGKISAGLARPAKAPPTEPTSTQLSTSPAASIQLPEEPNGLDLMQQARVSAGSVDRQLRASQPKQLNDLLGQTSHLNRLERAFAEAGIVVTRLEEIPMANGSIMTRVHAGGATYCVRSQVQPLISGGDPGARIGFVTTNCPQ